MKSELSSLHVLTLTRWIIYQRWRSHLLEAQSDEIPIPDDGGKVPSRASPGLLAAWQRQRHPARTDAD